MHTLLDICTCICYMFIPIDFSFYYHTQLGMINSVYLNHIYTNVGSVYYTKNIAKYHCACLAFK